MFPVDDVAKLELFDTVHLEWLAVFLSTPDRNLQASHDEAIAPEGVDYQKDPFNTTGIAVENLHSQLGLPFSGSQSSSLLSAFLETALRRCFWKHRNILEVSLHIDNMLALTADATSFANQKKWLIGKRINEALRNLGIDNLKDACTVDEFFKMTTKA